MYFLPVLLALATMMLYPSTLLAVGVGIAAWVFLTRGGNKPEESELAIIRGQLAYRVLSVKLMTLNGEVDRDSIDVHNLATLDVLENSTLRARMRDAADVTPEHWQSSARMVGNVYGANPGDLVSRLNDLIVQVTSQPACYVVNGDEFHLAENVQVRIMEIAKMWKIGPNRTRDLLADNRVSIAQPLLAWR